MVYSDVMWMVGVTITNLGYGEFTPSFWLSRIVIALLSLFGIVQTALIVQVVQQNLRIPSDEQRVLAYIEMHRMDQLRQQAAAKLIQSAWRQYKYGQIGIGEDEGYILRESAIASPTARYRNTIKPHAARRSTRRKSSRKMSVNENLMCDARSTQKAYQDALWHWRQIKVKVEAVERSKEFLVDDTAITSQFISRKLEQIEKIVRKGQTFGGDTEGAKSKWMVAGRGTLSNKIFSQKQGNKPETGQIPARATTINEVKDKISDEDLLTSLQTIQDNQQTLTTAIKTLRKSVKVNRKKPNGSGGSDSDSDSQEGLNLYRRNPDEHNIDRRGGLSAM